MANNTNRTTRRTTSPKADRTVFGTYVAPIFSSVSNQFTRRGSVFTGKNNTSTGRYSSNK